MDAYQAPRPGLLPAEGDQALAGVDLPPGRQVAPVLWISDDPLDDAGAASPAALRPRFPTTGVWPLVLWPLPGDARRPWDAAEFEPGTSTSPEGVDVAETLARWWAQSIPDAADEDAMSVLDPFDRAFPGLAPHNREPVDEVVGGVVDEAALDEVAAALPGRLGLVPVTRPADVFAVLGWMGPANHHGDMGPLSAVARSWEDRFGAEPVGLGFDTAVFGVRRPPVEPREAGLLAAEHFAVCPDLVYQPSQAGTATIGDYAGQLEGAPAWSFWWD